MILIDYMYYLENTQQFFSWFYRQSENGQKKLLSKDNLLLRGCVLRNTDYIEGIVIYAGTLTPVLPPYK